MLEGSIVRAIGTGGPFYAIYGLAALAMIGLVAGLRLDARHRRFIIVVAGAATFALMLLLSNGKPFGDFVKAYYPAGNLIVHDPDNVYYCAASNACFVNLPILAFLFTPFSLLPLPTAEAAFTIVGVLFIAGAAWSMAHGARDRAGQAVIGLFALSGPVANSVRLGNTTHHLLLVLLIAFEAACRGKRNLAGIAMGFAALMKPLLALFLLYFLLRGQFRIAGAMVATALAVILASVVLLGVNVNMIFLREFVFGFGSKPVIAFNVQNVAAAIGHFTMPKALNDWLPFVEPTWFRAVRIGFTGALILAAAAIFGKAKRPESDSARLIELSAMLCLSLMIAPLTWSHYMALLLLPLGYIAMGRITIERSAFSSAALALVAILLCLPVISPSDLPKSRLIDQIWVSHYFFGNLGLFILLLKFRGAEIGSRQAAAVNPSSPMQPI